ncbi:MAG: RimK family alpha-L-glutamate ligase [Planctomycetota bacterium]
MNILILSRNKDYYSTDRLIKSAEAKGHNVVIADPISVSLAVDGRNPKAFLGEVSLDYIDAVIPRIGMISAEFGVAVVKQFQMMGITVINNSLSIMRARDKLRCMQILARHSISVPKTVMTRNPAEMRKAIQHVGGPPVILKFLQGSQGIGVILAESYKAAESTLDAFWSMNQNLLIQEYIQESEGRDIRVVVTRDKPIALMRRMAKPDDFRSNIHRGGWGELLAAPEGFVELALQAARIIGLDVGGVDILESLRGPLILEINASPGMEGIESATGIDVAGAIIEFTEKKVALKKAKAKRAEKSAEICENSGKTVV